MTSDAINTTARKSPDLGTVIARLDKLQRQLAPLVAQSAESFTIPQFAKRHGFSHEQFYQLEKAGRAPRVMNVGVGSQRIPRVTRQAERDWIAEREAEAAAKAAPSNPTDQGD